MATNRMREIEEKEKRPIQEVLTDLYEEHGTQAAVAKQLNIRQSTLSYWLLKLGLEQKTVLVQREYVQ